MRIRHFDLYTDLALSIVFTTKKLTPTLRDFYDTIMEYTFTPHHLGIQNILPDALSRMWPGFSSNFFNVDDKNLVNAISQVYDKAIEHTP